MMTNVITINEARKYNHEVQSWRNVKNHEFLGVIPGLVCGWCVEVKKGDEYNCCSCDFTNNFQTIGIGYEGWKEGNLYVSETASWNGWELTGNAIFRGYYKECYDCEEREEYYEEVTDLSNYVKTKEEANRVREARKSFANDMMLTLKKAGFSC